MNLKKLFGCGAALGAAACLFASPSQAYDAKFHVYQAGNGVGDALIFPVYIAKGTWKTNLRVVNTSPTYSVVAKVVFREEKSSCETLDFFIYLSPNDEWTADVVDDNGTTKISSNDDSSPEVPLKKEMGRSCNGYDDKVGYVEVYGVAAMTFDNLTGPISKGLIQTAYSTLQKKGSYFLTDPMGSNATCVNSSTMEVTYDKTYTMRYYPSQNVLAGVEEVKDPSMNLVMPMVATALANNCNTRTLTVMEETLWDRYGYNSKFEVRSALAKSAIHIPYRNDAQNATWAVFNFPAKLSCCVSGGGVCTSSESGSCDLSQEYGTSIAFNTYDLQENTTTTPTTIYSPAPLEPKMTIEKEVYIGQLTPTFAEGWMRVQLTDAAVQRIGRTRSNALIGYVGSAVIPSYVQIAYDTTWVPATFDCGVVTFDNTTVDNTTNVGNCAYQLAPNKWPR